MGRDWSSDQGERVDVVPSGSGFLPKGARVADRLSERTLTVKVGSVALLFRTTMGGGLGFVRVEETHILVDRSR
jgi:hypothetical protein